MSRLSAAWITVLAGAVTATLQQVADETTPDINTNDYGVMDSSISRPRRKKDHNSRSNQLRRMARQRQLKPRG
jgi:hypothetical protein